MKDIGRLFGFDRPSTVELRGATSDHDVSPGDHQLLLQFRATIWADMANALWALEQKTRDPNTTERRDEFRPIARHIDRLAECLVEMGIEIQSHTNRVFDSGQSLEVVAFQPTAGITKEVVIETIRPTVYLKGHRLQIGQVIVATPEQTEEKN